MVKALILSGFGSNCEEETAAAYRLAAAEAKILHINELYSGRDSIHNYDILNFPGGFTFGDDISAARVLINRIKYKKMRSGKVFFDDIIDFLSQGKYILGIGNGFQALVKMGLLPNTRGNFEQEVTFTFNDSGKFENRWLRFLIAPGNPSPFLNSEKPHRIDLPLRCGEGRLLIPGEKVKAEILSKKLNVLSYADEKYCPTSTYPANPNASDLNCAGLCDPGGQILGIMPHPEAYLSLYNHPAWPGKKRRNPGISEEGQGLIIFRNIVRHIQNTRKA